MYAYVDGGFFASMLAYFLLHSFTILKKDCYQLIKKPHFNVETKTNINEHNALDEFVKNFKKSMKKMLTCVLMCDIVYTLELKQT